MFNILSEYILKKYQYEIYEKRVDYAVILPLLLFALLNALKITIFNTYISPADTARAFIYKYAMSMLFVSLSLLILLIIKYRPAFLGFYILQALYIFAHLAYFEYFHDYLHLSQAIVLLTEGTDAAGHLSVPSSPILMVSFLDLPFCIYIVARYMNFAAFTMRFGKIRYAMIVLFLFTAGFTEGWNYLHHYSLLDFVKNYAQNENLIIERYGTFVNSMADIKMNSSERDIIKGLRYGETQISKGRATEKPNIAVIQVEALDANLIQKQYKGQYITPFLQSLSKESVYYPYVLSYHKAGGTSDCEFSVINSVEPLDDFPSIKLRDYSYPNSFVKVLNSNGYNTIAFHGNIASYFSRDRAYPRMGFKTFDDMKVMGLKDIGWGAPDKDVFRYARNKLAKLARPFFSYTITMTSHGPYTNAGYYYNNSLYNDVSNKVVKDYFNSMSYVDAAIREYVEFIRSNYRNTCIFIWGDHTPNINTAEYKQASFIEDNIYFEFVPLFIITPANKVYRETEKAASFLDISLTILEASGVPYEIKSDGANLLNTTTGGADVPFKGTKYSRYALFNKVSVIN